MKNRFDIFVVVAGLLITLIFILVFDPVADEGDGSAYFSYAKAITNGEDTGSFIHRSPGYPWIIAQLLIFFDPDNVIKLMISIQFILNLFNAFLIYKILIDLNAPRKIAVLAFFLILINFSAIFFSYMLLTEIFAAFFLILTIFLFLRGLGKSDNKYLLFSGITISILALVRFNTLPLLAVFLLLIPIYYILNSIVFRRELILHVIAFLVPPLIILGAYSFNNKLKYNFFGLFPDGGSAYVSRNALISVINGDEVLSGKNREILNIFLNARMKLADDTVLNKKGSLSGLDIFGVLNKLYNGYDVYTNALHDLCLFFGINPYRSEPQLSDSLRLFFKEIRRSERTEILELRILSFLSSFRSSSGIVLEKRPDTNLSRLPGWAIKGYKLSVMAVSFFVFILSFGYLYKLIFKKRCINFSILTMIVIVFGFYSINFGFATVGDANRFKFPAEAIIIGLGVVYMFKSLQYLKLIHFKSIH